jgi:hypothetical protein
MAEQQKQSFLGKIREAVEATLDSYISKARTSDGSPVMEKEDRKSQVELEWAERDQYGWKQKQTMVSNQTLRSMARKDSVIIAIHQTRLGQINEFSEEQKDKYSPGWIVEAQEIADYTDEQKLELADPLLDEEMYNNKKYEFEKERVEKLSKQKKEIQEIKDFIKNCGSDIEEADTTYKRVTFKKFLNLITRDRLTYNYAAIELIPSKDRSRAVKFYPTSAGYIYYTSKRSQDATMAALLSRLRDKGYSQEELEKLSQKPLRYVQVVRGQIVWAWSEDDFIFEAANPTVDPEDNGYAMGELELLIQTITAHLFAEAHNRNFFTQGIGTKGLLHIKGDNISRAQLEGFKRQWWNQVANSKNAFRPPIIGMADEVKWVPLAQTNREMEFESWMHYLIRIICAVYQIDPAEINFDISKVNTSTLNESSNETRIKSSRDKGLKPLLDFIEGLLNDHILPRWNKELAKKYKFKFVGLDAESRKQETERLEKETQVWKTLNEARREQGREPIEDGDIVLSAVATQYKQMKINADMQAQAAEQEQMNAAGGPEDAQGTPFEDGMSEDSSQELEKELNDLLMELPDESADPEPKKDEAKKSITYILKDDEDNED